MSGLSWYMSALRIAIAQKLAVWNLLANCNCDRHQQYREYLENGDSELCAPIMWEDLLKEGLGFLILQLAALR
jgi:hypothetical protein